MFNEPIAIQKWYGEYSLPAEPYVVEAGTDLAEYARTHGDLMINRLSFQEWLYHCEFQH